MAAAFWSGPQGDECPLISKGVYSYDSSALIQIATFHKIRYLSPMVAKITDVTTLRTDRLEALFPEFTGEQKEQVYKMVEQLGEPLLIAISKLGFAGDADLARRASTCLHLTETPVRDFPATPAITDLSPLYLHRRRLWPLEMTPETLVTAMADPFDDFTIEALERKFDREVIVKVAQIADIDRLTHRYCEAQKGAQPEDAEADTVPDRLRELAADAPVIQALDSLFVEAVRLEASDIHLKPSTAGIQIRYRVDGALRPGPVQLVAQLYNVPEKLARDAVEFEERLQNPTRH